MTDVCRLNFSSARRIAVQRCSGCSRRDRRSIESPAKSTAVKRFLDAAKFARRARAAIHSNDFKMQKNFGSNVDFLLHFGRATGFFCARSQPPAPSSQLYKFVTDPRSKVSRTDDMVMRCARKTASNRSFLRRGYPLFAVARAIE